MAIALRWTLRDLIVPFVALTLCVVAYGMVSLVRAIVESILGTVAWAIGKIPFVGGIGESAIKGAENAISHALGSAAAGVENQIGRFWHALAREVESIGEALWLIAQTLGHLAVVGVDHVFLGHVYDLIRALQRRIDALAARAAHIVTTTTTKVVSVTKPIVTHVTKRVEVVSAAVEHAIAVDIPNLWHRERVLTDQLAKAWEWIRAHGKLIGEAAGVGAVAVALARLGFRWLTCRNVGKVGRQVCATDADILDQLLLDGLAVFGVLSVVEFAKVMRSIEDDAISLVGTMVREWP